MQPAGAGMGLVFERRDESRPHARRLDLVGRRFAVLDRRPDRLPELRERPLDLRRRPGPGSAAAVLPPELPREGEGQPDADADPGDPRAPRELEPEVGRDQGDPDREDGQPPHRERLPELNPPQPRPEGVEPAEKGDSWMVDMAEEGQGPGDEDYESEVSSGKYQVSVRGGALRFGEGEAPAEPRTVIGLSTRGSPGLIHFIGIRPGGDAFSGLRLGGSLALPGSLNLLLDTCYLILAT